MKGVAAALLICTSFLIGVDAKVEKFVDVGDNENHFLFLGKFCYPTNGGKFGITYNVNEEAQKRQTFCFYSDWEGQWPLTYNHKEVLGCVEKNNNAARCINITAIDRWFDGFYDLNIKSSIPRWWFVTLSNCWWPATTMNFLSVNSTGKVALKPAAVNIMETTVMYTNPNPNNDKYITQFSKDEQSIPQQCIGFLVTYVITCFLLFRAKMVAKLRGVSYEILRMMAYCVGLSAVSKLGEIIHYETYDKDGIGLIGLEIIAFISDGLAQMLYIGILMDISRGYTISTNFIANRRNAYGLLFLYMVLYIMCYIWNRSLADPALVLYIYESVPGALLMVLQVLMLFYMLKNFYETIEYEQKPGRKQFYKMAAIGTSIIMLCDPLATLGALEMATWDRAKMMYGITNGITCVSYFVLFYVFRPWEGNRFISILDPLDTVAFGTNNMQVFPEANRAFDGL